MINQMYIFKMKPLQNLKRVIVPRLFLKAITAKAIQQNDKNTITNATENFFFVET